jgi:hypothetical protein
MTDMLAIKAIIAQVVRAELADEFGGTCRWDNKKAEMTKVE